MRVFVGIDDTDNSRSRGTEELAEIMCQAIQDFGWGKCEGITRHQLFLHSDIPYTSQNSSMCFLLELHKSKLTELISYASRFILTESVEGSDPGLCIAVLSEITNLDKIMQFGQRAKREVISKEESCELAQWLNIHLSEHGGTGRGMIGALAGVGLRLTGNDGRFKGTVEIKSENNLALVRDILEQTDVVSVKTLEGQVLAKEERIRLGDEVKAVLMDDSKVLLVNQNKSNLDSVKWETC